MRKIIFISIVLFIIALDSKGQMKVETNCFITADVTDNYSTMKELTLQNFMDIEYVALETNDDFINQGVVLAIGEKIILVKNIINDGDIFVYDRTGKALRKINNMGGQSNKEYTHILGITLDEDNNEMFVNDPYAKKILVYDLFGEFKRSFKHKERSEISYYTSIFNYDKDNLICYDQSNEKSRKFTIVSKKNGSVTHEIQIPFIDNISLLIRSKNGNKYTTAGPGYYRTIIPFKGNWMLLELSSDTIYTLLPDYSLRPFLVRTPSIQYINPKVFLLLSFLSNRYYFMETMKSVYDQKTRTGFHKTPFMYDTQEKTFSRYIVYNGDYSIKKEVYLNRFRPLNHEIESWQRLDAYELVESYKKGELKGKLKKIAATLDEESNPVIMLIKHKK